MAASTTTTMAIDSATLENLAESLQNIESTVCEHSEGVCGVCVVSSRKLD